MHSHLLQRQILPGRARCQDSRLDMGFVSLRHLLLRRPRLGVCADRPALHHLLLHRAAHSPLRQAPRMAGLGRALRPHRALQPRYTLPVAVSATGGDLEGAPRQPPLADERRAYSSCRYRCLNSLDGA